MLHKKAIKSKKNTKLPFWEQASDDQLAQEYAAKQASQKVSREETKKHLRKQSLEILEQNEANTQNKNLSSKKPFTKQQKALSNQSPVKNNIYTPLFTHANEFTEKALIALEEAISQVVRQTNTQRKSLKKDIIELSELLTSERNELAAPYWTMPSFMAAYLNFFMPWNVVRLCQLLPKLEMPHIDDNDYILDLGSGPITCIIALWIAKPEYRAKKINIIATDVVLKPMELGLAVFQALAKILGEPLNWNVQLHRQSFTQALDRHSTKLKAKAKLILSANILNEVESRQKLQNAQIREIFSAYSYAIRRNLHNDEGTYLAIEPGTRQGGRLITLLREEALENSLAPHAPCTHNEICPFQENKRISSWCHMQCPAHAPAWLKDLAYNSGFRRRTLSLSFVQLKTNLKKFKPNAARLISNPFDVPQYGTCHYICSEHGLGMLVQENNNPRFPQIEIPHSAKIQIAPTNKRDRKSQALIAYLD